MDPVNRLNAWKMDLNTQHQKLDNRSQSLFTKLSELEATKTDNQSKLDSVKAELQTRKEGISSKTGANLKKFGAALGIAAIFLGIGGAVSTVGLVALWTMAGISAGIGAICFGLGVYFDHKEFKERTVQLHQQEAVAKQTLAETNQQISEAKEELGAVESNKNWIAMKLQMADVLLGAVIFVVGSPEQST